VRARHGHLQVAGCCLLQHLAALFQQHAFQVGHMSRAGCRRVHTTRDHTGLLFELSPQDTFLCELLQDEGVQLTGFGRDDLVLFFHGQGQ